MQILSQETMDMMKDDIGRFRTQSLFLETNKEPGFQPMYTFKDHDYKGCKSAKQIYLACKDVTEYTAAMALVGSWQHWKKLLATEWFMKHLEQWREELEIMLRSEAVLSMFEKAQREDTVGYNASKFIVEGKWKQEEKKRGRPTKEEVERERRIAAGIVDNTENDYQRLIGKKDGNKLNG